MRQRRLGQHLAARSGRSRAALFTIGVPLLIWFGLRFVPFRRCSTPSAATTRRRSRAASTSTRCGSASYALGGLFAGIGGLALTGARELGQRRRRRPSTRCPRSRPSRSAAPRWPAAAAACSAPLLGAFSIYLLQNLLATFADRPRLPADHLRRHPDRRRRPRRGAAPGCAAAARARARPAPPAQPIPPRASPRDVCWRRADPGRSTPGAAGAARSAPDGLGDGLGSGSRELQARFPILQLARAGRRSSSTAPSRCPGSAPGPASSRSSCSPRSSGSPRAARRC